MESASKKLSFGEKISYGLGDCGANVIVAVCSTFLSGYYTDTVGIAAAALATMMLIVRIFDGITDIIMGAIVDKTKSKWGKARPWVLWTAPFMAISLILLFNVPSGLSDGGKLVYAYITYIFQACIVYTANNLPYNALLSRMTLNVQDRASAASVRFFMTQVTTLIINAATTSLLPTMGWRTLSIIYALIAFVMLIICFIGCKEHIGEQEDGVVKVEIIPLKIALPALLKNKYFYIHGLLFCFLYIGFVSTAATTFYFCNVVLNNLQVITLVSMATTIPAMLVNLILPNMVKKFGKWKTMTSGAALIVLGSLIIGAGGSSIPVVMLGLIIKGIGMGPIMSGVFAMTADVVDYGEWKTGVRSEGLINSCTSFGMKMGIGLGSSIGLWILSIGGYDGTATVQTESAVNSIRFAFGYNGAILGVIVLILCFMMNIDKYIKDIQRDLEAKRIKAN